MERQTLSEPTREQAMHWMRVLTVFDALEGTEFALKGDSKRHRLTCLRDVALFVSSADDADNANTAQSVNFIDPKRLSAWVRRTIGDEELADRMDDVISTGEAYSLLIPQLKRLLLTRGSQCSDALTAEPPSGLQAAM